MMKPARLFAAMLALAGAFAVPASAHAKAYLMCAYADYYISNIYGGASYDYWSTYWLARCDN